ncbi:2-isopropylmalate synthase [Buchnera aphidicola (Eriosoma grossulariae)]|uniref:2-isopropylmalate synthase n=1 Tax=Buchnera aphidicola TaxID=9 RepID=UPI00346491C4
MKERIIIFDTTLRDGEQALQSSLTVSQKLEIALSLEKMGVDVIEVGFPISSPGDFESVKKISSVIKNSRICSLARCVDQDIDVAAESMKDSEKFRIHLFLGTSKIHVESKLRKNFNEIIDMAVRSIIRASKYTDDIEFSCEDAGRTSIDNLCLIVEKVIKAGATTINIPDTVGYTIPTEFSEIIRLLVLKVPNIDSAIISVHCHNDLGMAVGNSISAIQNGARQVEGTINGIGERAGNTALEEVIMAIKTKSDVLQKYTNIKINKIYATSKIVSQICQMPIPANKAIVGSNAFSHSSGIHQDGMIKNRNNYEIIFPESIGAKNISLNLTSRSGRAAVNYRMKEMGYKVCDYSIDQLYSSFLKLADQKGQVFDYDLEILAFANDKYKNLDNFYLKCFTIQKDYQGCFIVSVIISCDNKEIQQTSTSYYGPIDAIYLALNKIVQYPIQLKKFELLSQDLGDNSISRVSIIVEYNNRDFYGLGIEKDFITSSAQALINVFNYIWRLKTISIKLKNL